MITVTESAKKKIITALTQRGRGCGIKMGLKTTGCSGQSYVFEYLDQPSDDLVCLHHDPAIYTTTQHQWVFMGMTIDHVRRGLNEGFEFINPNEGDRCGCGQSFSLARS